MDGDTQGAPYDKRRNDWLAAKDLRTVRFTKLEVRDNIGGVLRSIADTSKRQPDRWPGERQYSQVTFLAFTKYDDYKDPDASMKSRPT